MQYSAINESHCGKANMTDHVGKEVIGLVHCYVVNKTDYGKVSMRGHEGK